MSWVKQNENLYNHSDAPFCIVRQSSNWFLIDTRDQSKAIPIDDIFNNPVFSINFENQVVLASHFRGEGVNTPASPAHSFKTEISSGLYRESAGVLAISSLGTKVLTIDSKPSFLCKAWVNFDGTLVTNPASSTGIRGSGNVSTILDNGTGNYTINFTVNMTDNLYSAIVSIGNYTVDSTDQVVTVNKFNIDNLTMRSNTGSSGNASELTSYSLAVFR